MDIIRSENPPAADGDPEPSRTEAILEYYTRLEDQVPAIVYVPEWGQWVCKGDIPPSQFPDLQAYLDEFPYQVHVSQDRIVVTDPGFGKGKMEWVVRSFEGGLVAVTETDAHSDSPECKIWIGRWADGGWDELTETALPDLTRRSFFAPQADADVLEDFELVGIRYELTGAGQTIVAQPVPNATLECIDGQVLADDIDEAQRDAICRAWQHFRNAALTCQLDPSTQRFVLLDAQVAR